MKSFRQRINEARKELEREESLEDGELKKIIFKGALNGIMGIVFNPVYLFVGAIAIYQLFIYVDYSGNGNIESYTGKFVAEACTENLKFRKGLEYDEDISSGCMTIYSKSVVANIEHDGTKFCMDGAGVVSALEGLVSYIESKPENMDKSAPDVILEALEYNYPCGS